MGNLNAKTSSEEQPLSWRAAIFRRLQIWRDLTPFLNQVRQVVGYGNFKHDPSAAAPETHSSLSTSSSSLSLASTVTDKAVTVVEAMLLEALRARSNEDNSDDQSADKQTLDMKDASDRVHKLLRGRLSALDRTNETLPRNEKDLSADHNFGQDNRGPSKPQQHVGGDQSNEQDDPELVAEVVRSLLDIALPKLTEGGLDAQPTQQSSAPSDSNHERNLDESSMVKHKTPSSSGFHNNPSAASPSAGSPATGLPATTQKSLDATMSNYLTWDKQLYSNLRLDPEFIRLVEIHPGSSPRIEVDLIKKPMWEAKNAYEALSYTWGSPHPKNAIFVNGVEVQVNTWLFIALKSLRLRSEKRCLWVDAIRINQASKAERSIEVQKMGEIYRLAKKVVIFHGSPSTTTSAGSLITALFKFLSRTNLNGASDANPPHTNTGHEDAFTECGLDKALVCKGFIDFCCRPWWRRVWTIQEFYLASEEPVWYWGETGISNGTLKRDFPLLMAEAWQYYGHKENIEPWLPKHIEQSTERPLAEFSAEISRLSDQIGRRKSTHGFDVPSRLYRSLSAKATDPRDLVYGLREIFDPVFRGVFVPDYSMQLELLYACLAVFLLQFEGWGDMLWWYPHRFPTKGLPSWLPDFTKRVVPAATELLPRDNLITSTPQLKLVVIDHALHAEGYKLDAIEIFTSIGEREGSNVLQDLWNFDRKLGRSSSFFHEVQTEDQLLKRFMTICRGRTSLDNPDISHPTLNLFDWTIDLSTEHGFPSSVVELLPSWDILLWQCFKTGSKAASSLFDTEQSTKLGLLSAIFSSQFSDTFQHMLSKDFIGDCVFDLQSTEHVLERLATRSPWSEPNSPYWQTMHKTASLERSEHADNLGELIDSFITSLDATISPPVDNFIQFTGLCSLILLDSTNHAGFISIVDQLRSAATKIHDLGLESNVQVQVERLASTDDLMATKLRHNAIVNTHFTGRSLFRTRQGFLGLTSPGTKICETSHVILLKGLSFPTIVTEFDEDRCTGRLIGCAVIKGVSLADGAGNTPEVPQGCLLGKERLLTFT